MGKKTLRRAVVGVAAAAVLVMPVSQAAAEPERASAHMDRIEKIDERRWDIHVYSPSMERNIPLQVIRPADTSVPRPTLYLLNGAGGGEDGANWLNQTNLLDLLEDKNVNVVIPAEGALSYYTDWIEDDPVVGRAKWTTFLTEELPPVIDDELDTTGSNAIGGLSMAATSVLDLAVQAPGLYNAVASYSGCAQTSDLIGQTYVRSVLEVMGRADATNMWGPYGSETWVQHDPTVNAEKLRGVSLYISNGTGLPGPHENPDVARTENDPPLLNQMVYGGAIEVATNVCTHRLRHRLDELGIPATFHFRPEGTHSWGYWEDEIELSWPQIEQALNS